MAYVSIGGLTTGGNAPDQPGYNTPPNVFDVAEDVEITREGIVPIPLDQELFTSIPGNVLTVLDVKLAGDNEAFVFGTATDLYNIYNGVQNRITRTSLEGGSYGTTESRGWQTTILHGIPIFNNSFDIPQQLSVTDPQAAAKNLENWPQGLSTRVLRAYKNFLIAVGIQVSGTPYDRQSIVWSAPADPGQVPPSWNFTNPATNAGLFTLSETDDILVDGLQLGEEFILYKEYSIYSMRFVGGTFIFSFKRRPGDIGLLAPDCVVNFPGGHFFIGPDDCYVYDGTGSPRSVADGRVRKKIFRNLNRNEKNKTFVRHYVAKKTIHIFYTETGSSWPNKVAVWDYTGNTWSFQNITQISSATFSANISIAANIWDSFTDSWGGKFETTWGEGVGDWTTFNSTNWATSDDDAPWDTDVTIWDTAVTWDTLPADFLWDVEEYAPITESIVFSTYIEETRVYDPLLNQSTASGVTWNGSSAFPPIFVTPIEGRKKQGRLLKTNLAITGQDASGNIEVKRNAIKTLSEFYPEMDYGKVNIRFGVQDIPNGEIFWEDEWEFDADLDQKVDPLISGKFLAFEITGNNPDGEDWLFSGYGMELEIGSTY